MQPGKKVYIYGTLLASSLALLALQGVVKKNAPIADDSAAVLASVATAPAVEQAVDGSQAESESDPRVQQLNNSLANLAALLPADRTSELEAMGRGWNPPTPVHAPAVPQSGTAPVPALEPQGTNALLLDALPPTAHERLAVERSAAQTAWLAANPLIGIAVSGSNSLAAFGGRLFRVDEELPHELGRIQRIETRSVVLSTTSGERRVALVALEARPADASPASSAQQTGSPQSVAGPSNGAAPAAAQPSPTAAAAQSSAATQTIKEGSHENKNL